MIAIMPDDILSLMPGVTRPDFTWEAGEAVVHLGGLDCADDLVDRCCERRESAEAFSRRFSPRSI